MKEGRKGGQHLFVKTVKLQFSNKLTSDSEKQLQQYTTTCSLLLHHRLVFIYKVCNMRIIDVYKIAFVFIARFICDAFYTFHRYSFHTARRNFDIKMGEWAGRYEDRPGPWDDKGNLTFYEETQLVSFFDFICIICRFEYITRR